MDTSLDVHVREALRARKGDWPRIAADAGVSHSWISQFVRDKIPNPGYATLRKLHERLTPPVDAHPQADGAPPVPQPEGRGESKQAA